MKGLTRVLHIMDDSSNVADECLPPTHKLALHKIALEKHGMHCVQHISSMGPARSNHTLTILSNDRLRLC